jgi:hypothetical protein
MTKSSEINLNGITYIPKPPANQISSNDFDVLIDQIRKMEDALTSMKARIVSLKRG